MTFLSLWCLKMTGQEPSSKTRETGYIHNVHIGKGVEGGETERVPFPSIHSDSVKDGT